MFGPLHLRFKLQQQGIAQGELALLHKDAVARALKSHGFRVGTNFLSLGLEASELDCGIGTGLKEAREVVAPKGGEYGTRNFSSLGSKALESCEQLRVFALKRCADAMADFDCGDR